MTGFRRAFPILVLVAFASSVSAQFARADDDIVRFFDDVVFGGNASTPVVKWTKAPMVRLETLDFSDNGDASPRTARAVATDPTLYAALQAQVATLAKLTPCRCV